MRPTGSAREAVVLQPDAGVGLTVVLDYVVGHSKMLREASVMHVAPKCLRPWPLEAKVTPFLVVMPAMTRVACVVLSVCPFVTPRA
jgi:hypothetical protein